MYAAMTVSNGISPQLKGSYEQINVEDNEYCVSKCSKTANQIKITILYA